MVCRKVLRLSKGETIEIALAAAAATATVMESFMNGIRNLCLIIRKRSIEVWLELTDFDSEF